MRLMLPDPDAAPDLPYRAMALVYDRWMRHDHAPYEQWCSFIDRECRLHGPGVGDILEIGCGTGTMTAILRDRGYRMTGVDASPWMLEAARAKLGDSVPLILSRLPSPAEGLDLGTHDAAICCFDTANYLVSDGELGAAFRQIAGTLRPGGLLIVDTNTQFKFEQLFGSYRFGDDLGDFAYVWRSHFDPTTCRCELLLSFFVAEGDVYRRTVERHVQRAYSEEEMAAAMTDGGFVLVKSCDDYSDRPRSATTQRATWVGRLA
jgi:SAM-dependent methyltransferase